jgi:ferredoxin, 2Fe-2S
MVSIRVVTRGGEESSVEGSIGRSVMETIRDNGIDELLALCGGCCSCATCHVYVDEEDLGRLPAMSDDENDLLDSSDHRTDRSRLSCQLKVGPEIDNIRFQIAPED